MRLRPGERVDWHSTGNREELLIGLDGVCELEVRQASRKSPRRLLLSTGQCIFIPRATPHRVINQSKAPACYLYVTG